MPAATPVAPPSPVSPRPRGACFRWGTRGNWGCRDSIGGCLSLPHVSRALIRALSRMPEWICVRVLDQPAGPSPGGR